MRPLIAAAQADDDTVTYATKYAENMAQLLHCHPWGLATFLRNMSNAVIQAAVLAVEDLRAAATTVPCRSEPSEWIRLGVLLQEIHALKNPLLCLMLNHIEDQFAKAKQLLKRNWSWSATSSPSNG